MGDVLSQTGQPLACADLWLQHPQAETLRQAEIVVQFGASLTGKRLLQWQAAATPDQYWLVDSLPGQLDPRSIAAVDWWPALPTGWRRIRLLLNLVGRQRWKPVRNGLSDRWLPACPAVSARRSWRIASPSCCRRKGSFRRQQPDGQAGGCVCPSAGGVSGVRQPRRQRH